MPKERTEEADARFLLEKYVYPNGEFINADKPDIQSKKLSIGIEHRFITDKEVEISYKFNNIYVKDKVLDLDDAQELKNKRFPNAKFDIIADDKNRTIGTVFHKCPDDMYWKVSSFIDAFKDKLDKLNSGGYEHFSSYGVFFTLDKYWVQKDDMEKMLSEATNINNSIEYRNKLKYDRLFLRTPSGFFELDIANGVVTDLINA